MLSQLPCQCSQLLCDDVLPPLFDLPLLCLQVGLPVFQLGHLQRCSLQLQPHNLLEELILLLICSYLRVFRHLDLHFLGFSLCNSRYTDVIRQVVAEFCVVVLDELSGIILELNFRDILQGQSQKAE